ncbi:MAG: complex I NDUFA9 subunit family protein [Ponticaulis sp.]|nr:complex I NDUFA9 subunit family protein [Ponticaulis sp.]
MAGELITVFGGSGFLGRYVVRDLCRKGYRVRVGVRNPGVAGDLRLAGDVGQVQIVQANVRNRPSIERAIDGASGVINLVGLLFERGAQTFDGSQALGAKNVAELSASHGITKFVQVSAIGADADAESDYARTKAEAEAAVLEQVPTAVILRPSMIFGPEDEFFNRFASMTRFSPALPAIGGGKTRLQPIFVGDVAKAVVAGLESTSASGRVFELGGPAEYTFKEIYEFILKEIDRPRMILPLPFFLAQPIGMVVGGLFKLWPFADPPITSDQVKLLKSDNVVGESGEDNIGTIQDLGITQLESIEAIVPTYLWRFRPQGQFHEPRGA